MTFNSSITTSFLCSFSWSSAKLLKVSFAKNVSNSSVITFRTEENAFIVDLDGPGAVVGIRLGLTHVKTEITRSFTSKRGYCGISRWKMSIAHDGI